MSKSRPPRIAIVAGEASGDLLGSHVIQALRAHCPDAEFFGVAGPKMLACGARSFFAMEKLSVNGLVEVLRHLPELLRLRRELKQYILSELPDLFIGIDAPDFNLGLEQTLKAQGIFTMHFVSPSIWAWRGERIHKIIQAVSHMLVVFPFEAEMYRKAGLPVTYVGHPLADVIPDRPDRSVARGVLQIALNIPVVAMLPGSRVGEVREHAQLFIDTAKLLRVQHPNLHCVVPLVNGLTHQLFSDVLAHTTDTSYFQIVEGQADIAMTAADIVLVASGTATLEAALLKRPMVITYKMARLTAWWMRRKAYLPWVGLPNILLQATVVPELLQENATAEKLASALHTLLTDNTLRASIEGEFQQLHQQLKQGTAQGIVNAVLPHLLATSCV